MIDKATLKKHNLKAVPFSCVGEGETFITEASFNGKEDPHFYTRTLRDGFVFFADYFPLWNLSPASAYEATTVYVPVWRPT